MATFRRRGDRWQAQVRRKGFEARSKSFSQRKDAERWATLQERDFDLHESRGETGGSVCDWTLAKLLARYRLEVIPRKRSAYSESCIVRAIERRDIATREVRSLKASDVAAYRDSRLGEIGSGGVLKELRLMQHAIDTARSAWGLTSLANPFKDVRKPSEPRGRERRLSADEEQRLLAAGAGCLNPHIVPVIKFAVATGMRQGEILALRSSQCDLQARVVTISITKNGKPRTVPLSQAATEILAGRLNGCDAIFPISAESLKQSWARLLKRADIRDLHFHDLRHEAISRFFEIGLELPEVMAISGHTDPRMLLRYTHLHARRLVARLDARSLK